MPARLRVGGRVEGPRGLRGYRHGQQFPLYLTLLESMRVVHVSNPSLARMRHLRNHPFVLAADPLPRGVLAFAATLALSHTVAALGSNVDHAWSPHRTLAASVALFHRVGLDSRRSTLHDWSADLSALR